jgi:hypothetical protein
MYALWSVAANICAHQLLCIHRNKYVTLRNSRKYISLSRLVSLAEKSRKATRLAFLVTKPSIHCLSNQAKKSVLQKPFFTLSPSTQCQKSCLHVNKPYAVQQLHLINATVRHHLPRAEKDASQTCLFLIYQINTAKVSSRISIFTDGDTRYLLLTSKERHSFSSLSVSSRPTCHQHLKQMPTLT